MNSHEITEVQFWRDLFLSKPDYRAYRRGELDDKTKYFSNFKDQKGRGLDLGCGLISVLEDCGKDFIAGDPLMDMYQDIVSFNGIELDGEDLDFEDNTFDWVFCVNVIDHTPNPHNMSDEIFRVLKPGGVLYFEVNFDDVLGPAHYEIWSMEKVAEVMKQFKLKKYYLDRNEDDKQYLYHAEYIK